MKPDKIRLTYDRRNARRARPMNKQNVIENCVHKERTSRMQTAVAGAGRAASQCSVAPARANKYEQFHNKHGAANASARCTECQSKSQLKHTKYSAASTVGQ